MSNFQASELPGSATPPAHTGEHYIGNAGEGGKINFLLSYSLYFPRTDVLLWAFCNSGLHNMHYWQLDVSRKKL